MIPILFSATLSLLSFSLGVDARSTPAIPAIQHLSPRAIYQGGWPLALAGSASTTCPSDTPVLCDSKLVNPACCPAGQTCIFGGGQDANYCCPTGADCNTAVVNFPQCANTTWTMFKQYYGGYFCCPPDLIGVNPFGNNGGLCEPKDQVVPASLLATVYAQATPKPSATPANATVAGNPNQANPTAPSSTTSHATNNALNGINSWSTGKKIGVGAAVIVLIIVVLALAGLVRRRRSRTVVAYPYSNRQYDEFGNPLPPPYGRAGYEPYRRANEGNNVTVNVVQGDLQH